MTETGAPAPAYHGWRVVAATFTIAMFAWGIGFYGPGIYLVALRAQNGWSTTQVSAAITLYYLLGATAIFFAARAYGRFGARWVIAAGTLAMSAGVVLLPHVDRPAGMYLAFAIMSLGWGSMSGAAINIIVAPWFGKRRGVAVSLALSGASVGGIVFAPLLVHLIERVGFATAVLLAAGAMIAVLIPTALAVLRPKRPDERDAADADPAQAPEPAEAADPVSLWQLIRDPRFQTISLPFALGLVAQVGFLTHQVAYVGALLGTAAAGWAVGLTTASAVAGRLVTGFVIDRIDRRIAASANFLVQAFGMTLMVWGGSPLALYLGCVLFGLGVGNMISLPGLLVHQEFSKQSFPRVVSTVVSVNQFTFAFGPMLVGIVQQRAGSYVPALVACLVIEVLAAGLVVLPLLTRRGRNGPPA